MMVGRLTSEWWWRKGCSDCKDDNASDLQSDSDSCGKGGGDREDDGDNAGKDDGDGGGRVMAMVVKG